MKKIHTLFAPLLIVALLCLNFGPFQIRIAEAASLTGISDTMSNQTISASSTNSIKFTTPTGISANQTFIITFPTGFTFTSAAIGDLTLSYGASTGLENSLTVAASPTSANWGAVFSGGSNVILTLTAPSSTNTIPASNKMVITYASTHELNPGSAANYTITLGGGSSTAADSGSVTVPILSNSQVAVTATVPQSLTFSLGSNTAALGTLSTSATASSSHTMTLATNGTAGASVSVAGTTLTSGANTIAACASGCSSTTGSPQFGINLVANTVPVVGAAASGSAPVGAAATNYNSANTFRFVTGETVATASNAINTTVFTVSYIANIGATTPAGSYATTLTYSATANF